MTSSLRLSGKRIAVTGGARGLGREFVRHLTTLGARVLAVDVLGDELDGLTDEVSAGAELLATLVADVTVSAEAAEIAHVASERFGGLDALVNNAGLVSLERRPFEQIPEPEWDRVFAVNVKGAWLCSRAAVPLLRQSGGGSIVNLGSEVTFSGSSGLAQYVASKAAVHGLTRVLARELGADGIRVNTLAPGFIPTEAASTLTGGRDYDPTATPLGRVGQPRDLLGALAFLVADESEFVTGQTLMVNGGRLFN